MSLVLVKEDGSGLATANSYASVDDGDAYHEGHLYGTAWTAASAGKKEMALVMATRLIDAEWQFLGSRANTAQARQWPRVLCPDPDGASGTVWLLGAPRGPFVASNVVPKPVLDATCELARALLVADRTADPVGEGLKSAWLGETGQTFDKADRRPVIPHVAQAMLAKFGSPMRARSGAVPLRRV